jgi:uncharacterized protein
MPGRTHEIRVQCALGFDCLVLAARPHWQYGLDAHLRAFGSLARGEATVESDVDLLVDLKPGRTLLDLAAFRREAGEILDLTVDVATTDMLKDRTRDEVLSEALPL